MEPANDTPQYEQPTVDIGAKSEDGEGESSTDVVDDHDDKKADDDNPVAGILVNHNASGGQQRHEHVRRRSVVTFEEVQKSRGRQPNRSV